MREPHGPSSLGEAVKIIRERALVQELGCAYKHCTCLEEHLHETAQKYARLHTETGEEEYLRRAYALLLVEDEVRDVRQKIMEIMLRELVEAGIRKATMELGGELGEKVKKALKEKGLLVV